MGEGLPTRTEADPTWRETCQHRGVSFSSFTSPSQRRRKSFSSSRILCCHESSVGWIAVRGHKDLSAIRPSVVALARAIGPFLDLTGPGTEVITSDRHVPGHREMWTCCFERAIPRENHHLTMTSNRVDGLKSPGVLKRTCSQYHSLFFLCQ